MFSNLDPVSKKARILEIVDSAERNRQCALWATVFGFEELDVVDFSDHPPALLVDYRRADKVKKEKLAEMTFKDQDVQDYIEKRALAEMTNKRNVDWLHEMLESLDGVKDHDPIEQIRERLDKFYGWYKVKYLMMDPYQENVIVFKHKPALQKQKNFYEPTDEERVMKELNEGF